MAGVRIGSTAAHNLFYCTWIPAASVLHAALGVHRMMYLQPMLDAAGGIEWMLGLENVNPVLRATVVPEGAASEMAPQDHRTADEARAAAEERVAAAIAKEQEDVRRRKHQAAMREAPGDTAHALLCVTKCVH